jgi:Ca-activated chloride channel family protein
MSRMFHTKLAAAAVVGALMVEPIIFAAPSRAAELMPPPCNEDAMIVFDASGSMAGNVDQGIATIRPRIDEARRALSSALPHITRYRRVGLITYGPGAYNQCNTQLNLGPTVGAADRIMQEVNALIPGGRTPLTSAVDLAAVALEYRTKPGVIVVLTDGEETCGRSPCELGKRLHASATQLTVHVISYRTQNYSWIGEGSILDTQVSRRAKRRSLRHCRDSRGNRRGFRENARMPDDFQELAIQITTRSLRRKLALGATNLSLRRDWVQ